MKTFGILLGLVLVTTATRAQNCTGSVYAVKGATLEFTEYDKEKKVKSINVTTVNDVQVNAGTVVSKFHLSKKDATGTVTEEKECSFQCNGDGQTVGLGVNDPKSNKELSLFYPATPEIDKVIPPGVNYSIEKEEDGKKIKVTLTISKRKIVGSEQVKTKAGSFDCIKLTYDCTLKLKLGILNLPINMSVVEWYSPIAGTVRTESWLKDNLEGYSELTALKK